MFSLCWELVQTGCHGSLHTVPDVLGPFAGIGNSSSLATAPLFSSFPLAPQNSGPGAASKGVHFLQTTGSQLEAWK